MRNIAKNGDAKLAPYVSIVVPVYNAEQHLDECINTIIHQTLKNIEILLIDDGSEDGSLSICRAYAEQDKRVRVIHQENCGAYAARNLGIQQAQGDYILFLDSDDFFELDLCERTFCCAQERNLDILLFMADVYLEDTNKYKDSSWLINKRLLADVQEVFSSRDVAEKLFLIAAGGPCNKLFKRRFLTENEITFPKMRSLEDVPFVYYAMALADRISFLDKTLEHYRKKSQGDGLVQQAQYHPTRIYESYKILKDRLQGKQIFDIFEQTFINRSVSDFIDQYEYVISDSETKKYFKLFYNKIIANDFRISDKTNEYYIDIKIYNRLKMLMDNTSDIEINNQDPEVSIIVPVYNNAPYLRQCLNSLIDQSFKNIEIILVDDGSTDSSLQILREYEMIDSRIQVLTQDNEYAGAARNAGMKVARGNYYLFLDSDDFFHVDMVLYLYHVAKQYDSDIVLCDGYYYDNDKKINTPARMLLQRYNIPKTMPFSYKDNPDKILHMTIDCPWNKLFKASFIKNHGLVFQQIRSANDVYFVDSAILLADRIAVCDRKLIHYRTNVHTSLQATRSKEPLNFYEALTAVKNRMLYEPRYSEISRSLVSLFVTGCRTHLDRAKNDQEFLLLYSFYNQIAFKEWNIDSLPKEDFVYVDDWKWIHSVLELSPTAYLLLKWRSASVSAPSSVQKAGTNKGMLSNTAGGKTLSQTAECDDGSVDRIKYYRSYKIGCALTWLPRKVRGLARCFHEHGMSYTLRRIPEHFGIPANAEMQKISRGVNEASRPTPVIVSLTSFPDRINSVHKAIESLLAQTVKPDMVILWLASSQFPHKLRDLPISLLRLRRLGLTIRWCDDIRSHKKYYYAMQEYPDAIVITADDDLYYPSDTVEILLNGHKRFPTYVCATRCHVIGFDQDGKVLSYKLWEKEQSRFLDTPSMLLFSTSGAGTLYPPHCMSEHLFDRDVFETSCPTADDVWLKTMQTVAGVKTVQIAPNRPLNYIEGSQERTLTQVNVDLDGNDKQIAFLNEAYRGSWDKRLLHD